MKKERKALERGTIEMPPFKPDQIEYLQKLLDHPPIDMDRVIGPAFKTTS